MSTPTNGDDFPAVTGGIPLPEHMVRTPTKLSEAERLYYIAIRKYSGKELIPKKQRVEEIAASLSAKDAELELMTTQWQAACEHAEVLAKEYEERLAESEPLYQQMRADLELQAKRIKALEEAIWPFGKLGTLIEDEDTTCQVQASWVRRAAKALEGE